MPDPLTLTILVLPRDGVFLALTMEHAFSATGRTKEAALDGLCQLLQGQAALDREAGRPPLRWMKPAQPEYRDLASRITAHMPDRVLDLFPGESGPGAAPESLRLALVG